MLQARGATVYFFAAPSDFSHMLDHPVRTRERLWRRPVNCLGISEGWRNFCGTFSAWSPSRCAPASSADIHVDRDAGEAHQL